MLGEGWIRWGEIRLGKEATAIIHAVSDKRGHKEKGTALRWGRGDI